MEKKTYRNAQRTRQKIKLAFLELIEKKPISKIRIHEITDIVEITKGAFYTHYQDIYAVFEDIENENINNLTDFLSCSPTESLTCDFTPFLEKLISQILSEKETYTKLFKSELSIRFLGKLQCVFVEYTMGNKELTSKFESQEIARNFFEFIAAGTALLIHNHLVNSPSQNLTDLCDTLNKGILGGLSAFKK